MEYLNRRGGRVHLGTIPEPVREFDHPDKGDALNVRRMRCATPTRRVPALLLTRGGCRRCRRSVVVAAQAMELALALEKLNFDKLQHLDKIATDLEDFNLAGACCSTVSYGRRTTLIVIHSFARSRTRVSDFVDDMLDEQAKDVKAAADLVAQLTRVGKGHGVWDFDERLYKEYK